MPSAYDARSSRQVVWLAGAAGLVLVMLAGGGWLAMRGLSSSPAVRGGAAATGFPVPVADRPSAFGAPDVVDGVPWGFPLTPDGAVAAALSAVTVTGQPTVVFDPSRFREVAKVVFVAGQVEAQAEQVDAARIELEASGWGQQPPSRRMYHFAPLSARLVDYDPDPFRARVEVWAMTLVGVGDAGGAVFTTSTVDLVPATSDDTWQVAQLDSSEGPTPLVQATASAPGRTRALLRDAVATLPLPASQP